MRIMLLSLICFSFVVPVSAGTGLDQQLSDWLVREYNLDTSFVRIAVVHCDLSAPDSAGYEIKIVPLVQSEPKGRFPVRVEMYQGGELAAKGSASLEIRRLADLLVPVRGIKRNEPLTADQFALKRMDITGLSENTLSDLSQLTNSRAKQDLLPDRYVPISRLEKIPDVENGLPVTIIASDGQLEIRTRGVALQNGRMGETIQVRNVESKKVVMGRVTGAGVVTIAI
jgi:flagella basal body P-ring formation protein FlgA